MAKLRNESRKFNSRYSIALMNNTKWREVLSEIASIQVAFSIAYIHEEIFGYSQILCNPDLHEYYIGDGCVIGGPVKYKEIFAVRIERFEEQRNSKTGQITSDESKSIKLLEHLKNHGLLPIEIDERHITIYGYKLNLNNG